MGDVAKLQALISPEFTRDVLEGILKTGANSSSVSVKSVDFGGESKKGDSYLSTVTRFSVNFDYKNGSGENVNHTRHMIAKGLPKNLARRKTFRSTDFFANEVAFYTKVWPALDAFQKSKNASKPFDEIPTCLASCADGVNDYILMEDLTYDGYKNAEKASGLNKEHVLRIIELFAKFHALGAAYRHQHPKEFEAAADSLKETYFSENYRSWYEKFQAVLKDITRDAVSKELPEKYLTKINSLFDEDFLSVIYKSCAERGSLAAITHGDAWIPNFLLRYDETNTHPLHTIMIDFQLTRCASITLDLVFFLYSCTDGAFLADHFYEVLAHYCKEFGAVLNDLGSDAHLVTVDDLKVDIKRHIGFFIGMSMEGNVMSLLDEDEVADIDDIKGDDAVPLDTVWIVHPFKVKEKRQRVAAFIKHAVDEGYL